MSLTSADLAMARYAAGEDEAFGDVYDAVSPALERFLLRRTQDMRLTEDLLQQTFLKIHCHRGSFRTGDPVLPWAYAIALRLLIDRTRRSRREARLFSAAPVDELVAKSQAPSPDQRALAAEQIRLLEVELARLPDAHRRAFEVVRIEERSHAEAAALLGTTETGVKLRLFRAVAALRGRLRGDAEQTPRVGP